MLPYLCSLIGETIAAIDRAIALWLERHFCFLTAFGARAAKKLARTASGYFPTVTAGLAALGLVLEAALGVEFLLTSGERELFITFLALDGSVLVHALNPHFFILRSASTDLAIIILRQLFPNPLHSVIDRLDWFPGQLCHLLIAESFQV